MVGMDLGQPDWCGVKQCGWCGLEQVEFHRYLLQLQLARCPKHKGWLGRKLWKTKRFVQFCLGKTC